jgi:hypothetical protein
MSLKAKAKHRRPMFGNLSAAMTKTSDRKKKADASKATIIALLVWAIMYRRLCYAIFAQRLRQKQKSLLRKKLNPTTRTQLRAFRPKRVNLQPAY